MSLDLGFRKWWSQIQSCTIRFIFKVYYCFLGHFPPDKKVSNYALNQGSHILFWSAFGFALIVWAPKGDSQITIPSRTAKHLENIKLRSSPTKARGVRQLTRHTDRHSHSQQQCRQTYNPLFLTNKHMSKYIIHRRCIFILSYWGSMW